MGENEIEPNAETIEQLEQALRAAQSGLIQGIICVAFIANGDINVMVRGDQNLVVRLGSLDVARDGIKLVETTRQQQRQEAAKRKATWGPGGNA